MSVLTAKRSKKPTPAEAVFLLENGASMDQPTFHELYKLTPEGFKAELIGGIVYVMASPTKIRKSKWGTVTAPRTTTSHCTICALILIV